MIRVIVEVQSARTGQTTRRAVLLISNDGTGTRRRGHYDVRARLEGGRREKTGRVEDFARQTRSIFDLVAEALDTVALNKRWHGSVE